MEIQWEDGPDAWVEVGERWMPRAFRLVSRPRGSDAEPAWSVSFAVRDGVPQCTEVTVAATEQGRQVRSADLRKLRLEDLLEGASANVARRRLVDSDGTTHMEQDLRTWREAVQSVRSARAGGRGRVTDELLREVAEVYRENIDNNPTQAVGEHLGGLADRTARLYVRRARDKGFLGESVRGKAGDV